MHYGKDVISWKMEEGWRKLMIVLQKKTKLHVCGLPEIEKQNRFLEVD